MKQDLAGKNYGLLTVIEQSSNNQWLCQCECGNNTLAYANRLNAGRKKSCGCLNTKDRRERPSSMIIYRMWDKILRSAKKRGIEVQITPQYAEQIFLHQSGKCALSGVEITIPKDNIEARPGYFTASLDRIDSNLGYIPGNVQWVHKTINLIKMNLPDLDFISWCNLVANKHPNNIILDIHKPYPSRKRNYNKKEVTANTKEEISEKRSKAKRKEVHQYSLNGEYIDTFVSCLVAGEAVGVSMFAISKCATGKNKTCAGFKWSYVDKRYI